MQIKHVQKAQTQSEARQAAIDWQNWQADQNLSYAELADWQAVFTMLASEFDLVDEFTENGIV